MRVCNVFCVNHLLIPRILTANIALWSVKKPLDRLYSKGINLVVKDWKRLEDYTRVNLNRKLTSDTATQKKVASRLVNLLPSFVKTILTMWSVNVRNNGNSESGLQKMGENVTGKPLRRTGKQRRANSHPKFTNIGYAITMLAQSISTNGNRNLKTAMASA